MSSQCNWIYNEFEQVGTDYAQPEEVQKYDARHSTFRDIEKENNELLDFLGIGPEHVLIDFGAGTGAFAVQAAGRGKAVFAVDVSRPMLDFAATRAQKAGRDNISFHEAGFLTYDHPGPPAHFITSTFALHHLPDYWKFRALRRLHAMLALGGRLFIHDVIIEQDDCETNIRALIDKLGAMGGENMRKDAEKHFKEEFSTFDWIMDQLFTRAGFEIFSKKMQDGVLGTYLCEKA